ncbi:S1 family peptidase [Actinokineospora globicatena]|uniref:S1 family peptidase n=2 Tax=Actinokineospora globicatena TaxID=103729 RepID=UPI0020A496D1|nr:S1 family peptidase [Actinokineospora globicatena]
MRKRRSLCAALVVVAGMGLAGMATPAAGSADATLGEKVEAAAASSPNRSTSRKEGSPIQRPRNDKMVKQQPLVDFVQRVRDLVVAEKLDGLVGTRIDVDGFSVTVYWHGQQPAALGDLVDRAPEGARVSVDSVPFSATQLDREAERLIAEYRGTVLRVGRNDDFTGLDVGISTGVAAAETVIRSAMPLTFRPAAPPKKAAARFGDVSPYWGGAMISTPDSSTWCTAGYTVNLADGRKGAVTAAHCHKDGNSVWEAGLNSTTYGAEVRISQSTDSMLLTGQAYDDSTYIDAWDSPYGVDVQGWRSPILGEYICDNGAFSGMVCENVLVWDVDQIIDLGGGNVVHSVFTTTTGPRFGSAGEGDSGGAAITFTQAGGEDRALILGEIIAIWTEAISDVCHGVQDRLCGLFVDHVDVNAINSALNVTPMN